MDGWIEWNAEDEEEDGFVHKVKIFQIFFLEIPWNYYNRKFMSFSDHREATPCSAVCVSKLWFVYAFQFV